MGKKNGLKWRGTVLAAMAVLSLTSMGGTAWAASYNQGLTGSESDASWLQEGIVKNDNGTLVYDFNGTSQTFSTTNKASGKFSQKTVINNQNKDGTYGTLNFNFTGTEANDTSGATALSITARPNDIVFNSNLNITASSAYYAKGISKSGSGTAIINGSVTIRKSDSNAPWGIITKNVHGNYGPGGYVTNDGLNYTGARWQPSAFYVSAGTLNVNGSVDVAVRGSAVITDPQRGSNLVDDYDLATINLTGPSIRIDTPTKAQESKEAFYSLANYGGTINVNVKEKQAGDSTVKITGNILAMKNVGDGDPFFYQSGRINLGLTNKDSYWKGVIDNTSVSKENGSDNGQTGEVNIWMTDGAQWIHESQSRTNGMDSENMPDASSYQYGVYDHISHVNAFYGGSNANQGGIIRQNDSAKLDIANYSGWSTVVYEHSGNGQSVSDYKGGDTVIGHAATGAHITLVTGSNEVDLNNDNAVANVLNALAQKLTYTNYASGESNLFGTVMIASGLTSSSITMEKQGMITFDPTTGKGGYIAPAQDEQNKVSFTTGLTGSPDKDQDYKDSNVLKEENGKWIYTFTKSPTEVTVADGPAAEAKENDLNISAVTLNLHGKTGIVTVGKNVDVDARLLTIKGTDGILANGGTVASKGTTNIEAEDKAVLAEGGATVTLGNGSIKGSVKSDGSSVSINEGGEEKSSSVTGDLSVQNGGSINLVTSGVNEGFTGNVAGYPADTARMALFAAADETSDGTVNLTVANGASWTGGKTADNTDVNLTLNGGTWNNTNTGASTLESLSGGSSSIYTLKYLVPGETENRIISASGFIQMAEKAGDVTVKKYSGTHVVSYAHDNDGTNAADYKGGDFKVEAAEKGSVLIGATNSANIKTADQEAVEKTLSALAQKFYYTAGDENLTGKALIASGLTSTSHGRWIGDMTFTGADGQGSFTQGSSVNIIGDFETAIMKGARAAVTSSLVSWRNNAEDLIYRSDLLRRGMETDGIWARTYGGKDTYDASGINLQNDYWGAQVGYDKVYHDGWIAGAALDYQDGSASYHYMDDDFGQVGGNSDDSKIYSLGIYGSKDLGSLGHVDISAKAGYIENDFTVYNGIGNELDGTYRNRGYAASIRYGKRLGSEKSYVEPQIQLTYSHVDAKDFTAQSEIGSLQIGQGSFDSAVGRIGVEAGRVGDLGSLYGRVSVAHEFAGDIHTTYFAEDGGEKKTGYSLKDTWVEATLGTTLHLGDTGTAYLDISKSFGGDYEKDWQVNGGVRIALGSGVTPGRKVSAPVFHRSDAASPVSKEAAEVTSAVGTAPAADAPVKAEEASPVMASPAAETERTAAPAETSYAPMQTAAPSAESSYVPVSAPVLDNGSGVYNLGPVVVTANRVEQPILDAKADISVVERKTIEEMHMDNVEEALRTVPGVQFLNYGSNGINANMSGIRINGSSDVVVLVDGVRVNDFKGMNSGYLFTSLLGNMDNIERVEVLRGSAATLYGSGAKGGVINIITRKIDQTKSMIDVARGSFDKESYKLNTQGIKGKFSYNVYRDKIISGDIRDGDGQLWKGHSNNTSTGVKTVYDFNDNQKLTFNYDDIDADYSGIDYVYDGPYKGSYSSETYTAKYDWQLSDLWSNTFIYRHGTEKFTHKGPNGDGTSYESKGDNTYDFVSDQIRYEGGSHSIVGGVEFGQGKDNLQNQEVSHDSYFIQDDWKILPKITLSGGARHDKGDGFDGHNSFSYKLSWDMTDKDSIYAGRSDFYIMPSINQLYNAKYGNKDLKPSEGRTTTIGYNREFSENNYFTLNWFETESKTNFDLNEEGQFINTEAGVTRGWNAQYHMQVTDHWALNLGWAHLNYGEGGSYANGYAPKDQMTFGVSYNKDKWSAAFDGFYFMRRTTAESRGRFPSDKYGVFNLSMNYAANKQTTFYMKVENIFNKLWAEQTNVGFGGNQQWYSMPGRSVLFGMQLKF